MMLYRIYSIVPKRFYGYGIRTPGNELPGYIRLSPRDTKHDHYPSVFAISIGYVCIEQPGANCRCSIDIADCC